MVLVDGESRLAWYSIGKVLICHDGSHGKNDSATAAAIAPISQRVMFAEDQPPTTSSSGLIGPSVYLLRTNDTTRRDLTLHAVQSRLYCSIHSLIFDMAISRLKSYALELTTNDNQSFTIHILPGYTPEETSGHH